MWITFTYLVKYNIIKRMNVRYIRRLNNMNEIKNKKNEIVEYWFKRVNESDLSVDASEAHERCWRCGYKSNLECCHIIPRSLGGSDLPSNLVLLCKRCHIENPNVNDPEIMWDWIRAYRTPLYDTFWVIEGFKEYEFIYGKSVIEEIIESNIFDEEIFNKQLKEEFRNTSMHFGHSYLNRATVAGLVRMVLKKHYL